MKVLFICENYLPHFGGVEVVFKNISERILKKGNSPTLLTHQLEGTKKKELIGGVKVQRVPSLHSRYIFTFSAIPKAIALAKKNDLIQTTTFNGAFPAWIAAKITGKPAVITVHEVWQGKWQKITNFPWFKSKIHEILERMIYTLPFDKYLCVSNATKKDLLKLNIKEKKVITIHNGFDYNSWDPEKIAVEDIEKIREEHSLKENFSLFSWGRPGESKGFEYLLKALPSIKERIPNVLLLLMLSSVNNYKENYQKLIALIKTLGIEKQVKIIQPVPHSELKKYLKAVDGVVIPSTAEGFGYTTVETNAIGTPAVVSNAGSLPEVVSGKFLMFESKNITELAEKVVKLSKKEYQETELKKFLWDDSIEKYLEVYTSLIDKK